MAQSQPDNSAKLHSDALRGKLKVGKARGGLQEACFSRRCSLQVLGSSRRHTDPLDAASVLTPDLIVLDPAILHAPETVTCPTCRVALSLDSYGNLRPVWGLSENISLIARRRVPSQVLFVPFQAARAESLA